MSRLKNLAKGSPRLFAGIVLGICIALAIPASAFVKRNGHWVFETFTALDTTTLAGATTISGALTQSGAVTNTGGLSVQAGEFTYASTAVTATGAELNFNDVTAGTLTASKALVADASSQIDIVDVTGSLKVDGDPAIQCETTTILTAAVQTLNATPVELVAAPGAGKFIAVQTITAALDYATAGYDGVGAGEDLSFQYADGAVKVAQDIDSGSFLDQTSDQVRFIAGTPLQLAGTADAAGFTPTLNKGIDVTILSGEIYAAAGDSPLKFRVCYSVQDDLLD